VNKCAFNHKKRSKLDPVNNNESISRFIVENPTVSLFSDDPNTS